jgi:hypothetical protein
LPNTSPDMSPTPAAVKGVGLDVDVHLAEVALDRFPGAAGGDAHLLVVVAGRAARGECIIKPEILFLAECIGGVGECRRALVCGHHEVGIVAVMADGVGGRHNVVADDVVGDRQKC